MKPLNLPQGRNMCKMIDVSRLRADSHSPRTKPKTWSFATMIITVRKRSCRKVMFLQAYVKNSVNGGGCIPVCTGTDTPPHPGQTATAADGTHPTGMHSCTRGNDHYHKLLPHQTRRHRIYACFVTCPKFITLKRFRLKTVCRPHFSQVEVLDVVQWRQWSFRVRAVSIHPNQITSLPLSL